MVQSPNPRRLVIFGGKIKDSQRPTQTATILSDTFELVTGSFEKVTILEVLKGFRCKRAFEYARHALLTPGCR